MIPDVEMLIENLVDATDYLKGQLRRVWKERSDKCIARLSGKHCCCVCTGSRAPWLTSLCLSILVGNEVMTS